MAYDAKDKKLITDEPMSQLVAEVGQEAGPAGGCRCMHVKVCTPVLWQEKIPLHYFSKSVVFYKELNSLLHASSLILASPDPAHIIALLRQKISACIIVRSATHLDALLSHTEDYVITATQDKTNTRFFNQSLVEFLNSFQAAAENNAVVLARETSGETPSASPGPTTTQTRGETQGSCTTGGGGETRGSSTTSGETPVPPAKTQTGDAKQGNVQAAAGALCSSPELEGEEADEEGEGEAGEEDMDGVSVAS